MTQTFCRMYAAEDQAMKAVEDLKWRHYQDIHVIKGGRPYEQIVDDIAKAYVVRHEAKTYAKGVEAGKTLVVCHAPFAKGYVARMLLDRHGPVDSGVPEPEYPSSAWDERAPLSSVLHVKTIAKTKLPFETVWNVPSLTRSPCLFSSCLGLGLLTRGATPFSSSFGLGTLSRRSTPFSSMFGLPLLSGKR